LRRSPAAEEEEELRAFGAASGRGRGRRLGAVVVVDKGEDWRHRLQSHRLEAGGRILAARGRPAWATEAALSRREALILFILLQLGFQTTLVAVWSSKWGRGKKWIGNGDARLTSEAGPPQNLQ